LDFCGIKIAASAPFAARAGLLITGGAFAPPFATILRHDCVSGKGQREGETHSRNCLV
jgi:hypothetical protein